MKKQNNILSIAKQAICAALAIFWCTACTEDVWEGDNSQVKEGVPVSVNLQFQTTSIEKVNTRLSDADEFQVNDLYLLIFDSEGEVKNRYYYDTDSLAKLGHINGNQSSPTRGTITNLQTTSGKSYIYGIANVVGNELDRGENLRKDLDDITDIAGLKALTTTLNNDGNIARTSASLLMSGAFQAENASNEDKKEGICTIPTQNGSIAGTLKLRRVDSHITFKITTGPKIESFEFKSWQVFNVPTNSYLIDQGTQYVSANYANSGPQGTYNNEVDRRLYSFDFYMQENLKKNITARDDSTLTAYKDREKEYKDGNGKNTGEYKYVEENATFIEIKARMNITPKEGSAFRTADVRYIIHLGGGEKDFANFNSLRNGKYTYNVQINDVESIIVEVENGEDDANARPGVEGDVVDAQTEIFTLDAHYNCFNLGFKYEDIVEQLSFIIQSPFAPDAIYSVKGNIGALENTPKDEGDYKWIKFQRTTGKNVLAKYKEESTLSLYDLVADMQGWGRAEDGITYYYTVFIDEYFYDEAPTATTKASWTTPLWKHFVNQEDRKLLLFLNPQYSADGESSYSKATYMFRQKSIQTYYSTETLNAEKNALGMEHINETGAPNWKGVTSGWTWDWSRNNGFYNTYQYFFTLQNSKNSWSDYVEYQVSSDFPYTYSIKDVAAIAECLSRNRDEDGDGKIDLDELKWYLPATDQLASMFLGAKSLPTPLFDDKSISNVTYDDGNNHYITSDKQKIWAEEGCSFGGISDFGDKNYPKRLRCVRNLGMSNSEAKTKTKVVSPAYTYISNDRVFIMKQLTSQNKRPGKATQELAFHDNFDDANRPYEAFQMAKDFINKKSKDKWKPFFDIDASHNSLCKNYEEGGHAWRAPNQREFMIMFLQSVDNVKSGIYNGFTRTHWKYNKARHFGRSNDNLLFLDQNDNYNRTIRCVRDVDVDANGNIIE